VYDHKTDVLYHLVLQILVWNSQDRCSYADQMRQISAAWAMDEEVEKYLVETVNAVLLAVVV